MYAIPFHTRLVRAAFRPVFRLLFHLLGRVNIMGVENIPPRGAYLIAANHISIFEPPLILAFWPVAPEVIAAVDIRQRRTQEILVRVYGSLRVRRGEYDRKLIDAALVVLRSGRPLVVFPEGGRSHVPGLRMARPGAAYLVEKSGAPVLPVGVSGTTADFFQQAIRGKRPVLEMRIGPIFTLPQVEGKGERRRQARQRNAGQIMAHIAALLPVEYRGFYGQTSSSDHPA
jgi:1-acyl-sn-glycerol-3-phosphate acyltransferase